MEDNNIISYKLERAGVPKELQPRFMGQRLLEHGFKVWFKRMFKVVEFGRNTENEFIHEKIHNELFRYFDDLYNLKIRFGVINIPPASAKTSMIVYFMAFCWAIDPKCKFIYTSFGRDLTVASLNRVRQIVLHEEYQAMYPYVVLDTPKDKDYFTVQEAPIDTFWNSYANEYGKDQNGKARLVFNNAIIRNPHGGEIRFVQLGSVITGFRAGYISNDINKFTGAFFIDDANKTQNSTSRIMNLKIHRYYADTIRSRLAHSRVPIINVQQRVGTEDLSAYLLENVKGIKHLKLPLVDKDGVCLIPHQYDKEALDDLMGIRPDGKINPLQQKAFLTQYQQEPTEEGGNIIKKEWFCYYSTNELPDKFYQIYQSWDTAFKTGRENDYSVCTTWGIVKTSYGTKYYLIDMWRGKVEYPKLKRQCIMLFEKYKPNTILIEDKASGQSLIQELKQDGVRNVKGVKVDNDKEARVRTITDVFYQGDVMFCETANYLTDLENELVSFPNGAHDDIVDSISQFINYLTLNRPSKLMFAVL